VIQEENGELELSYSIDESYIDVDDFDQQSP
jgi:hypothetical protein